MVMQQGTPRAEIVVARYGSPTGTGRITGLKARRKGNKTTVSWKPVCAAFDYAITVTAGKTKKTTSTKKTSTVLTGKGKRSVSVLAVNFAGRGPKHRRTKPAVRGEYGIGMGRDLRHAGIPRSQRSREIEVAIRRVQIARSAPVPGLDATVISANAAAASTMARTPYAAAATRDAETDTDTDTDRSKIPSARIGLARATPPAYSAASGAVPGVGK